MGPPRKLVAYFRVSTVRQGQSGLGLDAQESAVESARISLQGEVIARYQETESGGKRDRPELAAAIAHARKSKATLVVAKLDRLARDARLILELLDSGLSIYLCDFPSDPASPVGRMTVTILAAVAEFERQRIRERTREALAAAKRKGRVLGGVRPGQRLPSRAAMKRGRDLAAQRATAAATAAYAEVEPLILEARAAGQTWKQIADFLNDSGHRTRQGAAWCPAAALKVAQRARHLANA